jgi:predicted MFS family arabinose efflux permease
VVNAVYWSFAVDLVSGAVGSTQATGPLFYVALGVFGFTGLATGDAVARFGLGRTLAATLVSLGVAAGLLGLAPGSLPAVAASAVLFGSGVMFMSALLSVWSSAVFRERPSTGFSTALLLFGIGSIAGPAVVGAAADQYGLDKIFLLVAALAISTSLIRPAPDDDTRGPHEH